MQIAVISARITQLTSHLQQHKKDHSTTRGLYKLLGRRKRLLLYLYNTERCVACLLLHVTRLSQLLKCAAHRERYQEVITGLAIRPLKIRVSQPASQQLCGTVAAADRSCRLAGWAQPASADGHAHAEAAGAVQAHWQGAGGTQDRGGSLGCHSLATCLKGTSLVDQQLVCKLLRGLPSVCGTRLLY